MSSFQVLKTKKDLLLWCNENDHRIAFVPTMGSLHLGHQQLIQAAEKYSRNLNHKVLVTIFINPLQFGPTEDFEKYPRQIERDCKLAKLSGANAIWTPEIDDIFPKGPESHFNIKVPEKLTSHLCGSTRPGHFDGVVTVIFRLLKIIKAKAIFLGEKDWQQLTIIRSFLKDFNFPVQIQSIASVRESDGLPYSSRNLFLTNQERRKAEALPRLLNNQAQRFADGKLIDLNTLKKDLEKNNFTVEYVEIVDKKELSPTLEPKNLSLLAAAVHCGETRLIDHKFLMKRKPIVAIDGPAGAGKSTITKLLAEKLNLVYLDTGAMYRAVTLLFENSQIELNDDSDVIHALETINIEFKIEQSGEQLIFLNNHDVSKDIRSPNISSKVSAIAANTHVRHTLSIEQKRLGQNGGLIAEGRDIGTTIFPDAELKIFLTASPRERALRRAKDLEDQGFKVPELKDLELQIKERDFLDSTRDISPLSKAKDAQEIVTDGLSIDNILDLLIEMFKEAVPQEVWSINY